MPAESCFDSYLEYFLWPELIESSLLSIGTAVSDIQTYVACRLPATSTPLVHQPTPQKSTSGTRRANSSSPAYTQNLSATLQLQPAGIS